MLEQYHEGIICQSACVQGIIQQNVLDGEFGTAYEWARRFKGLFGDDFYMEIQDHGLEFRNGWNDRKLDEYLVKMAHELDIKVIATNDFHYLNREDAPTQDILSCIGKATTLDNPDRMKMEGSEFYMKTEDEMRELFSWVPEACDNTLDVASKCDYELDWNSMYLPQYPGLRPGESADARFREECEKGLASATATTGATSSSMASTYASALSTSTRSSATRASPTTSSSSRTTSSGPRTTASASARDEAPRPVPSWPMP